MGEGGDRLSLFLIFVYPAWFLIAAPLIAVAVSWLLEPASRLPLVATALAVGSVVLVTVYHVVSGEWAQAARPYPGSSSVSS